MSHSTKVLLISSMLLLCYAPMQSFASGSLMVNSGHRGTYTQVSVGPDRYYYNRGVFYTGGPGHYEVVEAPVGAVVYDVPPSYERVYIDGGTYYRYGNTYYRHGLRGYEVVRLDRDHGREHGYGHHR